MIGVLAAIAGIFEAFVPNSDWIQTVIACAVAIYGYVAVEAEREG